MFDESKEYYELVNNNMRLVDNSTIERPIISTEETTYYNNANKIIDNNINKINHFNTLSFKNLKYFNTSYFIS